MNLLFITRYTAYRNFLQIDNNNKLISLPSNNTIFLLPNKSQILTAAYIIKSVRIYNAMQYYLHLFPMIMLKVFSIFYFYFILYYLVIYHVKS